MKTLSRVFCILTGTMLCILLQAQPSTTDILERIKDAAMRQDGAQSLLRHLTDYIGPRVTGSPQSKKASEFILNALKEAGYENARLEEYILKTRWTRGFSVGRVISPVEQSLTVGSYGWAPGTKGEITANLVDLRILKDKKLPARLDGVLDAAVMVEPIGYEGVPAQLERSDLAMLLARSGAAAMLIPSDKPHRLLYTSAFCFYPRGPLPVLSIAKEDSLFLRRLLERQPVQLALKIDNSLDEKPAIEVNVVADLSGTNPDEMILIGAHFDSWDWAPGAQDNGSGVSAVVEVARILKSLNIRPRRTIRFVLFSGEEQGLLGSRAYVIRHREELDRLKSVLIMDEGAQVPRGFRIHGRTDIEVRIRQTLSVLSSQGASGISLEAFFDCDHAPFLAAGIPALTLWVDEGEYGLNHHAVTDTYDKVDPRLLSLDVATMAIATYALAQSPHDLGRRLSSLETEELLKRTGLEALRNALNDSKR